MIELKPFCIGPIRIDFPVVLAALAGYSDLPYRLICRELGAPYCATEMMLDRLLLIRGKVQARLFKITEQDHPIAGQIIGSEPAVMAESAAVLGQMGFDVVDMNFACPVRKALSRRRGGWLMSQPGKVLDIVRAVIAAVDRPVTLKLRQKFKAADSEDNFFRIAEGAFDAGVAAICVHARSVEAMYRGPADWEFIARVKQRFGSRTIIGSGDVMTAPKAMEMISQTGVDAVAVARGVLGNPWFFRQVRDIAAGCDPFKPSLSQQRQMLQRHFQADCEMYGHEKGTKHMRGFGVRYARFHPHPKELRIAFVNVKQPDDWQRLLDKHYSEA